VGDVAYCEDFTRPATSATVSNLSDSSTEAPSTIPAKRRVVRTLVKSLLCLLVIGRLYGAWIPWGASIQPFLLASVEGPVLSSPDGNRHIEVYFNDAGAAHSGNHWTWLTESYWLVGRVVVSEGYLGAGEAIDGGEIPVAWGEGNEFTVTFRESRHAVSGG
jgi:hypothetical protein